MTYKPRKVVIMPAYNVGHVLEKTIQELPVHEFDEIIVINDCSSDNTREIALKLGLTVIDHPENKGYGAAQKTGYREAIKRNADVVVMVHGDNQYDPSLAGKFARKILEEGYDIVTGTRMMLGDALSGGMPIWKFIPNRFLTWLENTAFGTRITDYHNGYRAYRVDFLKSIPFELLSDKFDFDTDIMIQGAIRNCRIGEIPHPTRFKDENSQMPFTKGVVYGLSILKTVAIYQLHRWGLVYKPIYDTSKKPYEQPAR